MSAERGEAGLSSVIGLCKGWDSYGGQPIATAAIHAARVLMDSKPFVVPCSNGGIQLEWHEQGVDFEIYIRPDGAQEME